MRASVAACLVLVLYGTFQNSEAGSLKALINPPVYLTFPVFKFNDHCQYNGLDVSLEYRRAIYSFATELYKRLAFASNLHAANSPLSMWLMLAAMAEGAEGPAQEELFKVLRLPENKCDRQQYYQLASKAVVNGPDATLLRTRVFAYDEGLHLNQHWKNYIYTNCLMNTLAVPMKRDPLTADAVMKDVISTRLPTAFSGNSAILDSLDYQALWTTAFDDAIIEHSPFYNDIGQLIGTMDMMKMKKRVRMAYLPDIKTKVLELPVGYNGRYRLMLGLSLGSTRETIENIKDTIVFEILTGLKASRVPIDIAIPRFSMTTEYDARPFLEEMGVRSIWTDSYGSKNISEPAAKPSELLQRVTITFDKGGTILNTEDQHPSDLETDTGLDPILGSEFIANRPFMFGLLDTKTYTVLMSAVFSQPSDSFVLKK